MSKSIETALMEDVVIDRKAVDESIVLYTKEYQKRGALILILSSVGLIAIAMDI